MTIRLSPGDVAPDLTLSNQDGEEVSLVDLHGRDVIVYFFPRAFTRGCTTQVCDFRDHRTPLARAGYDVLGVSGDSPARLSEFHQANGLTHALLSDPDHHAARRWGAFGPKTVNGQDVIGPLRSTFVIDTDGVVRDADYQVTPEGHVDSLLRAGHPDLPQPSITPTESNDRKHEAPS